MYNNLDSCGEYSLCTWARAVEKRNWGRFANTIAHFTNVQSIHSGFYKWKMVDDNQKKFIPQLPLIPNFS
jgi:hypothetical protein